MPLINFKVELKLKSTKYCALSAAVADNSDVNSINIISQPKKQNYMFLYVPKDNQKLCKLLSKGFVRSVYLIEYKTKTENKNATDEYTF